MTKEYRDLRYTPAMDEMRVKIVVEQHPDGFVAYPLGVEGVVVGQGDTYEEALTDVRSALAFHIETFGRDVLNAESPVLDATITDTAVAS